MKVWLYHFLCGLCMGTADLIPGVSGGTMAWIMGIYERLIRAINVVRGPWLKKLARGHIKEALLGVDWALLLPLLVGVLAALVIMVKLVGLPQLMRDYPEPVYGLFFGLILASVPLLLRSCDAPPWRYGWLMLGISIGLALSLLVPVSIGSSAPVVFISGMIAISAMLLPGVSGSFILLVLGQYAVILTALETADVSVLLPFVLGCAAGIICFAKLLQWLLESYHAAFVWAMSGLLLGALFKIWPFQEHEYALVHGKERMVSAMPVWPELAHEALAPTFAIMAVGMALIRLLWGVQNKHKSE